jgi:SIR2-like protein
MNANTGQDVKHVLLTGAGFSRNWGGWLAPEAFEYLIGRSSLDTSIRNLLWKHRRHEGFEGALGELQDEYFRSPGPAAMGRLRQLEDAIGEMFADMDKGFSSTAFEFQQDMAYLVRTFLVRFDAIFTLNQDLLLERHYLNDNVMLGNPQRWSGYQIPGMRRQPGAAEGFVAAGEQNVGTWVPTGAAASIDARCQPYIKLHGSSNWRGTGDHRITVMGARKRALIDNFPVLSQYHETLKRILSSGPARLMVIGYSFGDEHINETIISAANGGQLEIYIIDSLGIDVLDKNRLHPIYTPGPLITNLGPRVIGASRRTLREIFGSDHVEHAKVMSFFPGQRR